MVLSSEMPEPVQRLEKALAEIRRRFSALPVQAIPWMYLKHPIHPTQMELTDPAAIHPENRSLAWVLVPFRAGRCLVTAVHMTLQIAFLRLRLRRISARLKEKRFDLIAKTWAFQDDLLPGAQDFYYGDLQKRLVSSDVRMLLLTGKPENVGWPDFAKATGSDSEPCQLPELCLVPFSAPLRAVSEQLLASLAVLRQAARMEDAFTRAVAIRAGRDCLSPAVTTISLYYWIGREAVRAWHPKAVLALYEGYGWEQCLWRGVKEGDPACKTVGYQHTILLRHNLALLSPNERKEGRSHPEVVLCLGPRTEAMLRPSHPDSELVTFGTFRRIPKKEALRWPRPERRTVLVLPEGYREEAVLLFNAALHAARRLPDHRFVLRSHPVLPIEQVLPALSEDPSRIPNVKVSKAAPIEADFADSSVLLYRGSSSVLYGILSGLKPVYWSSGRFPEPDPLFEINGWRNRVSSVSELEDFLLSYAGMDPAKAAEEWGPAAEYIRSYTVSAQESSLSQLLMKTGIRGKEALVA